MRQVGTLGVQLVIFQTVHQQLAALEMTQGEGGCCDQTGTNCILTLMCAMIALLTSIVYLSLMCCGCGKCCPQCASDRPCQPGDAYITVTAITSFFTLMGFAAVASSVSQSVICLILRWQLLIHYFALVQFCRVRSPFFR